MNIFQTWIFYSLGNLTAGVYWYYIGDLGLEKVSQIISSIYWAGLFGICLWLRN